MVKKRSAYRVLVGKPERRSLRKLNLDRRSILKLISKKYNVRVWTGFIRLRLGTNGGLL